jgi:gp32 DNA binding protein like
MSFSNIKRNNNDLAILTKSLEKMSAKSTGGDNGSQGNYWKPDVDKSGNGMATFRFLPTIDADGPIGPWVKIYTHGFQGPGGWLIDNCLTTKGLQCPVNV